MNPAEIVPMCYQQTKEIIERLYPSYSWNKDVSVQLTRGNFDDALSFLNPNLYAQNSFTARLKQLEQHHLYLHPFQNEREGYSYAPQNIVNDTAYTVLLFWNFVHPQLNMHRKDLYTEGMAVCGFDIGYISSSENKELALHIGQFQTGNYLDEVQFDEVLGYIKYKDLFIHYIEQLALHIQNDIPALQICTMPIYSLREIAEVNRQVVREGKSLESSQIRGSQKRIAWNCEHGYNQAGYFQDLELQTQYEQAVCIKKLADVKPDIKLQKRLEEIFAE